MPEKILIGNFSQGLTQNRIPPFIDNDAFPTLFNFYSWRGRALRKRGTKPVGRLNIQETTSGTLIFVNGHANLLGYAAVNPSSIFITNITNATQAVVSYTPAGTIPYAIGDIVQITLVGGMVGINNGYYTVINTGVNSVTINFNSTASGAYIASTGIIALAVQASIVSGSFSMTVGGNLYTEPAMPDGTLLKNGSPDPGSTINYSTGIVSLAGIVGTPSGTGTFSYYPDLPVMGLRDYTPLIPETTTVSSYPQLLAFDTEYSYQNFNSGSTSSYSFFNVNYFKNPPSGTYSGYTAKTTQTSFVWTAQNYQQFWTTNYEQALWATNGTPGMQIQAITSITYISPISLMLTITSSPAVVGDFVFINEVVGTNASSVNGQTGFVTVAGGGSITVVFPNATIQAGTYTGGIIQYLTNVVPTISSSSMGDGIKLYDGDPTMATGLPSNSPSGWINFNPPLSGNLNQNIDNFQSVTGPFYLVGCKAILPYKDRILFFGCYIITSANAIAGVKPIYLQDTVIWSWNGSPYYTASFPASNTNPINSATPYLPLITPGTGITGITAEGAAITAYFTDFTQFGGYKAAGLQQQLVTVGLNEDVLIVSFSRKQTRFVYTGNDIDPFSFYSINSEFGASATFSSITLDRGILTFGALGITITEQTGTQRIDVVIPDQVFQISSLNFGVQRISSVRNYFKEWIYFTYPPQSQPSTCLFPTQSFFFNYRDNTWAIMYENYTAQGSFWQYGQVTWDTLPYMNWDEWTDPWDYPTDNPLFPDVVGGNPQGYVVIKDQSTGETASGYINVAVSYPLSDLIGTLITSINHCVQINDYLYLNNATGSTNINGYVGQVILVIDANNFVIDVPFAWNIVDITQANPAVITFSVDPDQSNNFLVGENITITGVVGMTQVNNNTYTITAISPTTATINVNSTGFSAYVSGGVATPVYTGLGQYTRMPVPLIQSKQFAPYWQAGRQMRIGAQQYMLDTTSMGQITANLYLSMDPNTAWNIGPLPNGNAPTDSLIYSQQIFTCPESTNIGLTPSNTNLQIPTAFTQDQTWHRLNTSLIGDTLQFGLTLNDAQMRNIQVAWSEIALHAAVFDVYPGPLLA